MVKRIDIKRFMRGEQATTLPVKGGPQTSEELAKRRGEFKIVIPDKRNLGITRPTKILIPEPTSTIPKLSQTDLIRRRQERVFTLPLKQSRLKSRKKRRLFTQPPRPKQILKQKPRRKLLDIFNFNPFKRRGIL